MSWPDAAEIPAKDYGHFIRTFREDCGLSLRELAALLGLADVLLSKIERGKVEISAAQYSTIMERIAIGSVAKEEAAEHAGDPTGNSGSSTGQ